MKKTLLLPALLVFSVSSFGQDAKQILQKSYDKCQAIRNGSYEIAQLIKFPSEKDTIARSYTCSFKKLKGDSLFSSAFHDKTFENGKWSCDVIYTGEDLAYTNPLDSTATIMSTNLCAKEIKTHSYNYTPYSPFMSRHSYPLLHDSDFIDPDYVFKYLGEEKINGTPCYHVQVNQIAGNDTPGDGMKTIRNQSDFWISKTDFIPLQYSNAFDMVVEKDTMYQYELITLNKYEINNLKDENILTLNSIPGYYTTNNYVPVTKALLLPVDTIAPNWELTSLTGEKINLNDLKGQLVLIDFFYKGCYPCTQALPALGALSDKYKSKGLTVIGIDPIDTKADDLKTFLPKHGVTYSVLLGGQNAAKSYHVAAYPVIYLIDRNGKIIYARCGYAKGDEDKLEEVIKKNL